MGEVVSFMSALTMKLKSKLNESKLQFYYYFSWERFQHVKWMNERARPNCAYVPTTVEHIANVCTHGVCVVPAGCALATLLARADGPHRVLAAALYGLPLCLLFLISTSFHSFCYTRSDCKIRNLLHRCDRAMIYIFIAGSYFPWLSVPAGGSAGSAGSAGGGSAPGGSEPAARQLRWLVWLLAACGIGYQQLYHERYKRLELLCYLLMGLGPAVLIFTSNMQFPAMGELKLGGLLYLLGVLFFKMDGCIPFAHAIWHVFVALAASVHYRAILHNLFPNTPV